MLSTGSEPSASRHSRIVGVNSPGRFWGVRNRPQLRELMDEHPPTEPRDLHLDEVPVVAARLRCVSTMRFPDGLAYHYAALRDEDPPPFWRVGFDHLGLPGRYLQCGESRLLDRIRLASRRHHCGRFGHNAFTPAGFTDLGALAQSARFVSRRAVDLGFACALLRGARTGRASGARGRTTSTEKRLLGVFAVPCRSVPPRRSAGVCSRSLPVM